MAYIKKKSERKFKITVCNGYKVNGQKRMKAQTITVPSSVPKRGIQQYVMAEAERIEKKFKYGVEESDQTHFEQYAENWLKRQKPFFKATTYAGYKRSLDILQCFLPIDFFNSHANALLCSFLCLAGLFKRLPARRCFLLRSLLHIGKKQYNILDFIFMRKKQLLF